MKYVLTIEENLEYDNNLQYLLENDGSDLEKEKESELNKWDKIVSWVKSHKRKTTIILLSMISLSVVIAILIRLLKGEDSSKSNIEDSVRDTISDINKNMNDGNISTKQSESITKTVQSFVPDDIEEDLTTRLSKINITGFNSNNFKSIRTDKTVANRLTTILHTGNGIDEYDKITGFDLILKRLDLDKNNNKHDDVIDSLRHSYHAAVFKELNISLVPGVKPPFWDETLPGGNWLKSQSVNKQIDTLSNRLQSHRNYINKYGNSGDVAEFDKLYNSFKDTQRKITERTATYTAESRIVVLKRMQKIIREFVKLTYDFLSKHFED